MNIGKYIELYTADLQFKNYAKNTIENYACQLDLFLRYFDGKFTKPSEVNEREIKNWLMQAKTINSRKHRISAIKLFYIHTVKQPLKFKHISYPRSEQHLPQPLSQDEVMALFQNCDNRKHMAILGLLFVCGLRVGEVIALKPEHIDRANMVIHIKQAKGMKDRMVPMTDDLLKLLEKYYREYRPKQYMFEGQFGPQYSARSINQFIKAIGVKSGIKKRLYAHIGRHSCFSQMLANGVDMAIIQRAAGHKNISTTQIYAKVTSAVLQNTNPYKGLLAHG
jgi:site-specific recombinase XerD